jgi:hypothetical protein
VNLGVVVISINHPTVLIRLTELQQERKGQVIPHQWLLLNRQIQMPLNTHARVVVSFIDCASI